MRAQLAKIYLRQKRFVSQKLRETAHATESGKWCNTIWYKSISGDLFLHESQILQKDHEALLTFRKKASAQIRHRHRSKKIAAPQN